MEPDLLETLKTDFPNFNFKPGKKFAFRPPKTIFIGPDEPNANLLLLHELAHALLGHVDFKTDLERLKMESAAWTKAKTLAKNYHLPFNEEFAETELDTYRNWLHIKSKCSTCGLTCYQTEDGYYHCPRCENFLNHKKRT